MPLVVAAVSVRKRLNDAPVKPLFFGVQIYLPNVTLTNHSLERADRLNELRTTKGRGRYPLVAGIFLVCFLLRVFGNLFYTSGV